jgi:light-regulated signal transduction histidine kinase (bacteriophytochrome)
MKEAEEQVVQYAEKLKQTNSDLEQFAYVASHDLQEPLRTVSAYADVLAQEYAGKLDANADKYLGRIRDGATRMKTLIQGLLQFSRVGHADTPFDRTNIEDALSEAMVNLDAAIRQHRAEVTRDPLPCIVANRTFLVMLFQNLIGNAIKFRSQQPPRIHVSAARNNEFWLFSVRDNGLGIDAKYHQRIFGIFQRLHTQKEYAGTGIGLALCKKIVELHGGVIWVESEFNKGSTFKFTLPADRPIPTK